MSTVTPSQTYVQGVVVTVKQLTVPFLPVINSNNTGWSLSRLVVDNPLCTGEKEQTIDNADKGDAKNDDGWSCLGRVVIPRISTVPTPISEQNLRNVMRQVTKLAKGEGIRYESAKYGWPEGCYFCLGRKITPLSDIVELMRQAQDCENKCGRDHGNGWLLSHPLKKLLLFQQFVLHNPSFLKSKCRIKDYNDEEEDEEPRPQVSKKDKKCTMDEKVTTKKPSSSRVADHGDDVVGTRVAKDFDGETYYGTVDEYRSKAGFWHVTYDDNDQEEYDKQDLETALQYYKTVGKGNTQNKQKKKKQRASKKRTAAAAQSEPPQKLTRTVTLD